MRHILQQACLVLAILVAGSAQAEAGLWDWLDELNGPGPSDGRGNFMFNLFCSGSAPARRVGRVFQIPRDPDARETCLYFDRRWFHAEEDDRFHPVNVTITEFGPSFRLHRAVELGAGVGWMSFSSRHGVTNQNFEGTSMTITISRLALKPLVLLPGQRFRSDPDWGFLQFYIRETVIATELTEVDFASKPGITFKRTNPRVSSMGFIVDVPSAFRLIQRALN